MLAVLGPAVTTAVLLLIMTLDLAVLLADSWCLGLLNKHRAWGSIDRFGLGCECDHPSAETNGWFKLPVARRPRMSCEELGRCLAFGSARGGLGRKASAEKASRRGAACGDSTA